MAYLFPSLSMVARTIPFSILPIIHSFNPGSAESVIRLITNKLFLLQLLRPPLCLLSYPQVYGPDSLRLKLPTYALGSFLLFYHHHPRRRSKKLAFIWSGPYRVIDRRHKEYSLAAFNAGVNVNWVHSRFLQEYLPPSRHWRGNFQSLIREPLKGFYAWILFCCCKYYPGCHRLLCLDDPLPLSLLDMALIWMTTLSRD